VAVVACSRPESSHAPIPDPPPLPARDASAPAPVDTAAVPPSTKQIVTAIVDDWNVTRATLRSWRRELGTWHPDGPAWSGVVGKAGTAWGAGLHGAGAPAGRSGPIKRE